jgi:hypothetical protein
VHLTLLAKRKQTEQSTKTAVELVRLAQDVSDTP